MFTSRPRVYWFTTFAMMLQSHEKCCFAVPFGAFGKILKRQTLRILTSKLGGGLLFYYFLIAARHQSNFEAERHSRFCNTVGAVGALGERVRCTEAKSLE